MRRFLAQIFGAAMLVSLIAPATQAQDNDKEKEKNKSYSEEIIIKKKNDQNARVVIEIKGDEVLVNGKPAEEFEDDNISIRKRKGVTIINPSPFRIQGGPYSAYSEGPNFFYTTNAAYLGVFTQKDAKGARIMEVKKESPAEKAGLKKGDVITKIDNNEIDNHNELSKVIAKYKPEDKVKLVYLRDGKENTITVTLGKRNAFDLGQFNFDIPGLDLHFRDGQFPNVYAFGNRPRLGIKAQDTEDGKGVKVIGIDDEPAADKAGLKENDIITEFDGKTVNSTDELSAAAREAREKASVKVKVERNGKAQTLEIKTPRKLKTANL